jgi:hypothetical protein
METTFKRFVIAGMVMTGMAIGNSAAAADKDIHSMPLTETRQHKNIQTHINAIQTNESRIDMLKDKIKTYKKADDDAALLMARHNMRLAKADLKHEKAYLKADKKALLDARGEEIDRQQNAKKDAKRALKDARCELKKDLRKGNTAELEADAKRVKELTRQYDALAESEFTMRQERNEYVLMINEEIREAKGESLASTSSENTLARLDNLFLG